MFKGIDGLQKHLPADCVRNILKHADALTRCSLALSGRAFAAVAVRNQYLVCTPSSDMLEVSMFNPDDFFPGDTSVTKKGKKRFILPDPADRSVCKAKGENKLTWPGSAPMYKELPGLPEPATVNDWARRVYMRFKKRKMSVKVGSKNLAKFYTFCMFITMLEQ